MSPNTAVIIHKRLMPLLFQSRIKTKKDFCEGKKRSSCHSVFIHRTSELLPDWASIQKVQQTNEASVISILQPSPVNIISVQQNSFSKLLDWFSLQLFSRDTAGNVFKISAWLKWGQMECDGHIQHPFCWMFGVKTAQTGCTGCHSVPFWLKITFTAHIGHELSVWDSFKSKSQKEQ